MTARHLPGGSIVPPKTGSAARVRGGVVALAIVGLVLALARVAAHAAEPALPNPFAGSRWDDGKAEFSTYVGTTLRYGQLRPTEARLIVVKEDLLRDQLVKSDAGPVRGRTVEALKLNWVADFQTGTYTYHQMTSVFFERASLAVLKQNMSHTEACGITTVRVGPTGGRWVHEAHSYWEGEADREVPVAWPAAARERWLWDGLPVSLRPWVASGAARGERKVWMLPSQVSGRSPIEATRPVEATLRLRDAGTLQVPAGRFAARRIEVATPAGTDTLWFSAAEPYLLLQLRTASGRRLSLAGTQRLDYWNHHMNGDEAVILTRR